MNSTGARLEKIRIQGFPGSLKEACAVDGASSRLPFAEGMAGRRLCCHYKPDYGSGHNLC